MNAMTIAGFRVLSDKAHGLWKNTPVISWAIDRLEEGFILEEKQRSEWKKKIKEGIQDYDEI